MTDLDYFKTFGSRYGAAFDVYVACGMCGRKS